MAHHRTINAASVALACNAGLTAKNRLAAATFEADGIRGLGGQFEKPSRDCPTGAAHNHSSQAALEMLFKTILGQEGMPVAALVQRVRGSWMAAFFPDIHDSSRHRAPCVIHDEHTDKSFVVVVNMIDRVLLAWDLLVEELDGDSLLVWGSHQTVPTVLYPHMFGEPPECNYLIVACETWSTETHFLCYRPLAGPIQPVEAAVLECFERVGQDAMDLLIARCCIPRCLYKPNKAGKGATIIEALYVRWGWSRADADAILAKLEPSERVAKRGRAKAHVGRNTRRNVGKGKGKGKSIDIVSSDDAAEPAPAPEPPPVAVQLASPAPGPVAVALPVPPQAVGRRRLHNAELSFDRCPPNTGTKYLCQPVPRWCGWVDDSSGRRMRQGYTLSRECNAMGRHGQKNCVVPDCLHNVETCGARELILVALPSLVDRVRARVGM